MPTATKSNGATHAGGVVYRQTGASIELLLVSARVNPSEWVLPKGHIEPGELPQQTAVREVFEEAGVTVGIIEFLTTVRLVVRGASQQIEFFLMERMTEQTPTEGRRLAWLTKDEAIARITYEESRAVLIQAYARLAEGRNKR